MSEMGGFPDLSGILARVTENPQAMSMLTSLLGGMPAKAPPTPDVSKERPREKEEEPTLPALSSSKPHKDRGHEERRRLLIALKPFLSKERKEALETLLIVLDAISLLSSGKEPPCT